MKTFKIAGLFVLLSLTNICAQFPKPDFPEKLTFLFNNDVKMVIESKEILAIPQDQKQENFFRNLVADISKVQDSLSRLKEPLIISYSALDKNNRKLKVTFNTEAKAEFVFTGNSDTVVTSFFNYRIESNLNGNNKLIIYTNKLSSLMSLNEVSYVDIIRQVKSDIEVRKIPSNNTKKCEYSVTNNQINVTKVEFGKGFRGISPSADFGLSYLNDHFIPHVSVSLAYIFSKKAMMKSMLGLSFEGYVNMDPQKAYTQQENYFVDVFYNPKYPFHPFFYFTDIKFLAGYLVHREGDIFPKDTWRFGFDMPAGKNFRITYVVYMNTFKNDHSGLFEIGIKYKFF